ncbi:Ig-like domain-containing protein [Salisediminibacterium selenitireducens]|uniref:SbsA Ig-like domain-containing protein n=1 Tax=Bacillus selenitireducens (strain ATCC 700615 / DSM 15326 / MLS10) TaxID=439292 RepID=D6Y080_BACIE|nr:Ig-like domain-containing protein [Salisediminibacterium selenitireducens]ADH98471.1 hypothetical protein Bsel_0949 [[Bacillus] selenitireducens MLS10]
MIHVKKGITVAALFSALIIGANFSSADEVITTDNPMKTWTIEFSDDVDTDYIDTSSLNVKDQAGNKIDFSVETEDHLVKITPNTSYRSEDIYQISISEEVRSTSGKTLESPYTRYFVYEPSAPDATAEVSVQSNPELSIITVDVHESGTTSASYTLNGETRPLNPSAPGQFSTGYTGEINGGSRLEITLYDSAGNPIADFTHDVKGE